jgi:hypothetical protein
MHILKASHYMFLRLDLNQPWQICNSFLLGCSLFFRLIVTYLLLHLEHVITFKPFGLTGAPGTFQGAMNSTLAPGL